METKKNKDLLVQELQNEVKILNEIMTNQSTIIGIKEQLLYQFQEKIDELERKLKQSFYSFNNRDN